MVFFVTKNLATLRVCLSLLLMIWCWLFALLILYSNIYHVSVWVIPSWSKWRSIFWVSAYSRNVIGILVYGFLLSGWIKSGTAVTWHFINYTLNNKTRFQSQVFAFLLSFSYFLLISTFLFTQPVSLLNLSLYSNLNRGPNHLMNQVNSMMNSMLQNPFLNVMPTQHQHMLQSNGLNVHPQQQGAMMPFGGMAMGMGMGMGGMANPFGMQSMFQTVVSYNIIV